MGKQLILLLTFLFLTSCSGYKFNFTCNDFSSDLSLEENAKKLKECERNQFKWSRKF